jgi:hypothetical protein
MINLKKLRVSQTKNGYQKIPALVIAHPRGEILENVYGVHPGINLERSQVANILGAAPGSDALPAYWDEIRAYSKGTIEAFGLVAVLFSHYSFIETLLRAQHSQPVGYLPRGALSEKAYTNLAYALSERGVCEYRPGSQGTVVNFSPIVSRLRSVGRLVQKLLRDKLARCNWVDPDIYSGSQDLPFMQTCLQLRFHEVFGLSADEFKSWMSGLRPTTRPENNPG